MNRDLQPTQMLMNDTYENMSILVWTVGYINSFQSSSCIYSCLRYMSMLSLNRKTPFALKTPSMPSGNLGKGSLKIPLLGCDSADLSVTRTSPCALMASIRAGTIF